MLKWYMRTLILHIGTLKTGSTALQRFFRLNAGRFASLGVHYPRFPRQYCTDEEINGLVLGNLAREMLRAPSASTEEHYRNVVALLEGAYTEYDTVLLSDETLSLAGRAGAPEDEIGQEASFWGAIFSICEALRIDRTLVIIYLRRQDALAATLWKHFARTGSTPLSFGGFLLRPIMLYFDYEANLRLVESTLRDSCELVVRRYDCARFYGGDIYHDFCHAAGIPWDPGFIVPEGEVNPSLSFDMAEAVRCFCDEAPQNSALRTEVLVPKAYELAGTHPDPPGMTPLSPDQVCAFMEPFEQGNRILSDRFFGGEPLFSNDYDNAPVWEPNLERIEHYRGELRAELESKRAQ